MPGSRMPRKYSQSPKLTYHYLIKKQNQGKTEVNKRRGNQAERKANTRVIHWMGTSANDWCCRDIFWKAAWIASQTIWVRICPSHPYLRGQNLFLKMMTSSHSWLAQTGKPMGILQCPFLPHLQGSPGVGVQVAQEWGGTLTVCLCMQMDRTLQSWSLQQCLAAVNVWCSTESV